MKQGYREPLEMAVDGALFGFSLSKRFKGGDAYRKL